MERSTFLDDVLRGLTASPKFLMSKYFYDKQGDYLFEQIMKSKEYYPTRSEMSILKKQSDKIADALAPDLKEKIDIIELGAGDAVKSIHLIRHLHHRQQLGAYYPIDISEHIISLLQKKFKKKLPGIAIEGLAGEYFTMLPAAMKLSERRKAILFLGGNMGNFLRDRMMEVCKQLFDCMNPGDNTLIGVDLKKDPRKILAAYNDKSGYTAAFNLNLLKRMNRELGANFKIDHFSHYPNYDPYHGNCKSFLISEKKQSVLIDGKTISFDKGEPIFMEVSQKFSFDDLEDIARKTGFVQQEIFMDKKHYFADVLWHKP